jgi:hypothetical protein
MPIAKRTWKTMVYEVVERQPRRFHLSDVLRYSDELRSQYPRNRFVEAKIRQSLQVLWDQGVPRFLGKGNYERIDAVPVFTPFFDLALANDYTNRAQIARILIETWAEMNLYCLNCSRDALGRLPPDRSTSWNQSRSRAGTMAKDHPAGLADYNSLRAYRAGLADRGAAVIMNASGRATLV